MRHEWGVLKEVKAWHTQVKASAVWAGSQTFESFDCAPY